MKQELPLKTARIIHQKIFLFFILLFLAMPHSAFAFTWQNVSGFLSANPAPAGCANWIEEVAAPSGTGYKIWQRCGGGSSYAGYFLSYWYNGNVYGCGGTKYLCNGTVHSRFNYGDMDMWQRDHYCGPEGWIAEGYDCRLSDRLLTEFVPVEQCLDRLGNNYTSCFRNCGEPVYSSYTYNNPSEVCGDGIDNNCNGQVDEGCVQCANSDGDGYTDCSGDCDDSPQTGYNVYPGAFELCDGKDNNCDTNIDETCNGCSKNSTPMGSSANLASGNLYHSEALAGVDITIFYNSLDTYSGPLGRGWTHGFNLRLTEGPGDSLSLMKADGRRVFFRLDGGYYRPEAASGEYSVISKNADGTYSYVVKDGTVYAFNPAGAFTSIEDRNGNTTALAYVGEDLSSVTDPHGRVMRFIYDSNRRIIGLQGPGSQTTAFEYDDAGNLTAVVDPLGNFRRYTYDAEGRMFTKTDPAGNTVTYSYDGTGKIISSVDPSGEKEIAYDTANNRVTIIEQDGGVWTRTFDPVLNVPLTVTDPRGDIIAYAYDSRGNLLSVTGPDGSVTSYTYDSGGNMASETDALGHATSYAYNQYGQATGVTYPDGSTASYAYDSSGNLISSTDPGGAVVQYQYDSRGNVTGIIDPNGRTTALAYDSYDNLASITGPGGAVTSFTHDASGNMISMTDPAGATTGFEYDSLDRLIRVIDPKGNITAYTYDGLGNRASETDGNGNTSRYGYDRKGRLTSVTDALGSVTAYAYGSGCQDCGSEAGSLTSIRDAKGNTTAYLYDALGRLAKETSPLGYSITYVYDTRGNLASKTDAKGNTVAYTYDSLNRLIAKTFPDSTTETFTYDARGNITSAANKNISYSLGYDTAGRLVSVTDSKLRSVIYQYDGSGNRIRMTAPGGKTVSYSYDSAGRLSAMTDHAGGAYSFTYDSAGRRKSLTFPNGVTAEYGHDTAGRLTSLIQRDAELGMIARYAYTYDGVGNRLERYGVDKNDSYTYDALYRLLGSITTSPSTQQEVKREGFTYDPVGNRLTSYPGRAYTYDAGNELVKFKDKVYTYDHNGNLAIKTEEDYDEDVEIEGWTYSYDYENRLVKAVKREKDELKTVTFKYDPFGRRMEKKVESVDKGVAEMRTYTYVYDNEDIVIEYTASAFGEETARFVHGPGIDEPLAMEKAGKVYYYHADGLGSIVKMTDGTAKVAQAYEYDSFGKLHDKMNAIKQPYAFTGREFDKDTGLYYYRARYYDAEAGRFTTKDPVRGSIERPQTMNPYPYAENNPVNYTDPGGMYAQPLIALCTLNPPLCLGVGAVTVGVGIYYYYNPLVVPRMPTLLKQCKDNKEECERQYAEDIEECKRRWPTNLGMRAACYSHAMARMTLCEKGLSVPPLQP